MRGVEQIPWLYDATTALAERLGLGPWRDWLVEGARGRTLDVGCGTGRNLPGLVAAGARVVGLDVDLRVMQRARRRAPAVPLVGGSAEALPFRDRAFDTVTSGLVFCSVPDPLRGYAELRRVLAPDGELRMLEHGRSPNRFLAWLQDRIQPLWTRLSGGCRPNRVTEELAEAGGFRIVPETYRRKGDTRRFVARPADG